MKRLKKADIIKLRQENENLRSNLRATQSTTNDINDDLQWYKKYYEDTESPNPVQANIPVTAPSRLIPRAKMPMSNAGKSEEAARPKASATVPAA